MDNKTIVFDTITLGTGGTESTYAFPDSASNILIQARTAVDLKVGAVGASATKFWTIKSGTVFPVDYGSFSAYKQVIGIQCASSSVVVEISYTISLS